MGLPIWDGSIDSEENYLRTKIPMDSWTSQSGASLFAQLKDIGFTLGEDRFYAIRRDVLNIVLHESQISTLREDTPIPFAYMDYVPTWKLKENYMYLVRYNYTVGDDPTVHEDFYTRTDDIRLTKSEIEQYSAEDLDRIKYKEGDIEITIQSVSLVHVYYKEK